jgi:DNA-binding transcriptional MocR family regulator
VSEQSSWVRQYEVSGTRASEIAAGVEAAVSAGRLAPGTELPPVRELAEQLGINPNTAAAAYRVLRDRGTVETRGRLGTRIRERPATSPASRVLTLPPGTLDLSSGYPDPDLLPRLEAPRPILPSQYVEETIGAPLLNEARPFFAADGVPADHVLCTFGALDGIDRVLTVLLRAGDRVAVEDPGWAQLLDLLAADRLIPLPVPVDDDGPDPAALAATLAAGAKAFITTTRAQNPYGSATTAERAAALRAVLADHPDVLTIDDDHGSELADGAPRHLVASTSRWAYVRSASKAYGPDLRIALLSSDAATHDLVAGRLRHTARHVSRIIQETWAAALADRETQALVLRAAQIYDTRRAALLDAMADRGLEAHGRSGLNVWVPVPDESAALSALLSAGFAAAPGAWFRLRSGPGLRVTTARLDPARAADLADAFRSCAVPINAVHANSYASSGRSL